MLAKTWTPSFNHYPAFVQPKLNGIRGLYQHGKFQSRGEKFWRDDFVEHIVAELRSLDLGDLILDGEFYVHGWKLQRINSAMGVNNLKKGPSEDTRKMEFHVFDVVDDKKKFSERWLETMSQINEASLVYVKVVPTEKADDAVFNTDQFKSYVFFGYEGIILRPDGPYEFGARWSDRASKFTDYRSPFLWKRKSWEDGEWVCVGCTPGEGKASIGVGSLQFQHWNKEKRQMFDFSCGTGFDDNERIDLAENDPRGKLVRLRFPYVSEDGVPQCPSFVAIMS